MAISPVIEFSDQLHTFSFKLSGKYDPEEIEIIGYGLIAMIHSFFDEAGKEEPALKTVFSRDASSHCMGEQLCNMYFDENAFKQIHNSSIQELDDLCDSPSGTELEQFLLNSVGISDCFPMAVGESLHIFIREGYAINPAGTFGNIAGEFGLYDEYTSMLLQTNPGYNYGFPDPSLYIPVPDTQG